MWFTQDAGTETGQNRRVTVNERRVPSALPLNGNFDTLWERGIAVERVQGFGGFFFRSEDPDTLAAWYRDMLGINLVPTSVDQTPWMAKGGATVFAPFAKDTDYFSHDKTFMLNFRVGNLAAMVAQLEDAGIAVEVLEDIPGVGRFAHLADPEGTPIELWEPEAG